MLRRHDSYLSILLVIAWIPLQAQLHLQNASFEGNPQDATVPVGWHPCAMGTTPDILPGPWGVFHEPSDGDTFVGLITRDDGTFESVGQRLGKTLKAKDCYSFAIDLAHSKTYAGYDGPIKVRVWGGISKCAKNQLLLESEVIKKAEWETYEFQFYPKNQINYIIIEAYYREGVFSYKGNILIDNIRPIKKCLRAEIPMQRWPDQG